MKPYTKYGLISLLVFLIGCGGSTENTDTPLTQDQINQLKGKLELGPIAGATVEFKLLDGTILSSTISDDTGNFTINISKIEKELLSLGYDNNTPFYIYGENGVDIDPNDDGIIDDIESKDLNGYVKGIVTINHLKNLKSININLLSTYISDSVSKEGNEEDDFSLINARSQIIIDKYDLKDINKDGIIDINDVYSYSMRNDDEFFEAILRIDYLNQLHSGDKDKLNEIQSELNEEININIIFKPLEKTVQFALLELHSTQNVKVKVEKECKTSSNSNLFMNNGDRIKLFKDCTIIYRSCQTENNCSNDYSVLSYNAKSKSLNPYIPYILEGNSKKLKNSILMSRKGYIINNTSLKKDLISTLNESINKNFSQEEEINKLCSIYEKYDLDCPK